MSEIAEKIRRIYEIANELEEMYPGAPIHVDPLSLSVACHIGPGSLAVACSRMLEG